MPPIVSRIVSFSFRNETERERDGEREYRNRISVWVRVKGERKTLGTGEVDREGWKKKGG